MVKTRGGCYFIFHSCMKGKRVESEPCIVSRSVSTCSTEQQSEHGANQRCPLVIGQGSPPLLPYKVKFVLPLKIHSCRGSRAKGTEEGEGGDAYVKRLCIAIRTVRYYTVETKTKNLTRPGSDRQANHDTFPGFCNLTLGLRIASSLCRPRRQGPPGGPAGFNDLVSKQLGGRNLGFLLGREWTRGGGVEGTKRISTAEKGCR